MNVQATNNEYDVPKSSANCQHPDTPKQDCTHVIKSQFKARDLITGGSGCMVSGDPNACGDVNRIETQYGGLFKLTYSTLPIITR